MPEHLNDDLVLDQQGAVWQLTFNRPYARNALTWSMYDGLERVCDMADDDPNVRILLLRGSGEQAFVAGTDIRQFDSFDADAGIAYEAHITRVLKRLLAVRVPVLASIRGYCVGGGLAIAACADIRVADASARFGVPIARTLGNTLSAASTALLEAQLGRSRVASLLLTARMMQAEEALACGFITEVAADLDKATMTLAERIARLAPLTQWATKELLRRRLAQSAPSDDTDVVGRVYGSEDFARAVAAFARKEAPQWEGR